MIDESKRWPESFPDRWASEWGEDEHGLWMAFHYKQIRHVMRWIEPGTFMMGSPDDELGRNPRGTDEVLHMVTLSEGFWLGETTVTQELWLAVTGENPSYFKGDERPVEQVSWEEIQVFLGKINRDIFGLELNLPTEAQWEFACRAGTSTPFSFGDKITQNQINYNSHSLYSDEKKGGYRTRTVEAKALPCNTWGLYQMHGNVWEWCQDFYGEYSRELVIDPAGPDMGHIHVCRGGSWNLNGRYCRSAYRYWQESDFCNFALGFRLARGRTGRR